MKFFSLSFPLDPLLGRGFRGAGSALLSTGEIIRDRLQTVRSYGAGFGQRLHPREHPCRGRPRGRFPPGLSGNEICMIFIKGLKCLQKLKKNVSNSNRHACVLHTLRRTGIQFWYRTVIFERESEISDVCDHFSAMHSILREISGQVNKQRRAGWVPRSRPVPTQSLPQ